jgi:MoaA/NifB/PqqE/SkfB family radical SAM enzyme
MEYVRIKSLNPSPDIATSVRDQLLNEFGSQLPDDCLITTDGLELLSGEQLLSRARSQGLSLLPLRRVSYTRLTKNFPKRFLLELTNHCNSLCTMCPRNVLNRPLQHMDTVLAKEVIAQLAEAGISGLWLYNIGESLLHPDFFEILDYCAKFNSLGTIWLSTNGEILSEEIIEKILHSSIDILNYSVNAMSEENFKKIAPQLHFHQVHSHFKALLRRKRELGRRRPFIRAQMIKLPYVLHEVDEFISVYGDQADIISINELEVFSQNVATEDGTKELVINERILQCNRLEREDFFIFADGSVSCCDTDFNCALNLGTVKEQTVQEIYNGDAYRDLLTNYRAGRLHEVELCSRCKDFAL